MGTKNFGLAARASALVLVCASLTWGAVTGSIAGALKDPTGSVIPGVQVAVKNEAQGVQTKTVTDTTASTTCPAGLLFFHDSLCVFPTPTRARNAQGR